MSRIEIQRGLLGDDLYELCVSKQPVPANHLQSRAEELKIPSWKLLQICDINDISIIAGDAKYDLSIEPNSLPKRENYDLPGASYTTKKILGSGSYGEVYLAESSSSEKVAIKRFIGNREEIDYNEIDLLSRWDHPHVFHAKDILYDSANRLQVVLPLAQDLMEVWNDTIPIEIRVRWVKELLDGMAFIQSQGYFYCDMKPENCFFLPINPLGDLKDPMNLRLVVGDLGLTYPYEYRSLELCGTYFYTSLEMAKNYWSKDLNAPINRTPEILTKLSALPEAKVTDADMFLAGNTAFYILTGQTLWGKYSDDNQVTSNILSYLNGVEPVLYRELDTLYPTVADTIRLMLHVDPNKRPRSFVEVLDMMDTIATPGYVLTAIPSKSLVDLPEAHLRILSKSVKKIIVAFNDIRKKYGPSEFDQYDAILNAIILVYRTIPLSVSDQCKMEEIVAGCVYIAGRLAWSQGFISILKPIMRHCAAFSTEVLHDIAAQITMYLKGTLRYSLLYQLCESEKELHSLLRMSVEDPKQFIKLLMNPWVLSNTSAQNISEELPYFMTESPYIDLNEVSHRFDFHTLTIPDKIFGDRFLSYWSRVIPTYIGYFTIMSSENVLKVICLAMDIFMKALPSVRHLTRDRNNYAASCFSLADKEINGINGKFYSKYVKDVSTKDGMASITSFISYRGPTFADTTNNALAVKWYIEKALKDPYYVLESPEDLMEEYMKEDGNFTVDLRDVKGIKLASGVITLL